MSTEKKGSGLVKTLKVLGGIAVGVGVFYAGVRVGQSLSVSFKGKKQEVPLLTEAEKAAISKVYNAVESHKKSGGKAPATYAEAIVIAKLNAPEIAALKSAGNKWGYKLEA